MGNAARSGFWWIASVSTAGVLLLWMLLGWWASTQRNPGDFGDMFGASNALFAGLAFAILIATLHSQREELALQREELTETRRIFMRQHQRLGEAYEGSDIPEADDERRLITAYAVFYREVEYMLGPYFRVLYNVMRYVDESRIADKKIYANLVRAQLTSHELALMFYSAAFYQQGVGMRKYLGRYNLLKHMPVDRLFRPAHVEWMATATHA